MSLQQELQEIAQKYGGEVVGSEMFADRETGDFVVAAVVLMPSGQMFEYQRTESGSFVAPLPQRELEMDCA